MLEIIHQMSKKVAIITDSHFGIKKANDLFLESQIKFFKEQFVPYLEKNDIKEIFFLGDVFDNRVSINIKIKNVVLDMFENLLADYKIYLIIGNHDCHYTNSTEIHSLKFLDKLQNIRVVDDKLLVNLANRTILLSSWIIDEEKFIHEIENMRERIDICMGHFAINGFHLNKFRIEEGGMPHEKFSKFTKVFSGHLHCRGVKKIGSCEIVYVGSPYQLTRADSNEPRGFCVLDIDSMEYSFVDNNVSLKYIQLEYPQEFTEEMISGNIIDVNVKFDSKTNDDHLQQYIKKMEGFNPLVPPTIVPINNFMDKAGDENIQFKTLSDLMKEYINTLDINNRDEIYSNLEKLYEEARNTL